MDNELDSLAYHYPEQKTNNWMLTFADVLSLMLTFFVLLYSMKIITQARWEEIAKSLQQRLNPEVEFVEFVMTEDKTITKYERPAESGLDYLFQVIAEKLDKSFAEQVTIAQMDDRIIISLSSDVLFNSGSADIHQTGFATLNAVSDAVSALNNKITIKGHTDPNPIRTAEFPSNRELSLARAHAVAEHIRNAGYHYQMDVLGMADYAFDELSSKLSKKKRYRLARRVDIEVRNIAP